MIKLFVFLGNPGKKYEKSRHNAGFIFSDMLYPKTSWNIKFESYFAKEGNLFLLKPLTFMNLSGRAVQNIQAFYKLKPEEILIFHDDLELPFGELKLEKGGALHGHNGLRSIKENLKSDQFYHLRIGIGRPKYNDVALYVTSPFTNDEMIALSQKEKELKSLLENIIAL